jgi:hypothetical protein
MLKLRYVEALCGALGGALGLAALVVAQPAPLSTTCINRGQPGADSCYHVSVIQSQGLASVWVNILLVGTLSLGIALFGVGHSRGQHALMLLSLLWACTLLLCGYTLVVLLSSVAVLFMPADVLALIASLAGTVAMWHVPN